MSWSNSGANLGRRKVRDRGSVVWKDNSGAKPAPFAQNLPRYEDPRPIPTEVQDYFYVGAMWQAKQALMINESSKGGKCPALTVQWWQPETAPVKLNSILIYADVIRHDEVQANGRIVTVPRHTFIAGEGRYIVTDFSWIAPVT